MLISNICIKRPVFATVLSLIITTLGLIFATKLQIRQLPDIDQPIITVTANYEGADALYMEQHITTRLEQFLKNVKHLETIISSSVAGQSTITLTFKLSADIEIALNDVRSKISDVMYLMPKDMHTPSVSKMDSDSFPSLWLTINSDQYDRLELTRITEERIKNILEKLPTVGDAAIYGAKHYTMRIEPDYAKMYQHHISHADIANAINKQNQDYPAGIIKTGARDVSIRLNAKLSSPEEFRNIILKSNQNNSLKLQDIAKIYLAPDEDGTILRYNGMKSMAVGIIKQSKTNEIDLSNQVATALTQIRANLPAAIKIEIAHDSSIPIRASIKAVFITSLEALFLVTIVVYLFLASARITIIPFVTIPVSLIATFTVMYFFGFSINTFTLLAMILAIGLVVDDAIVMLENIYRHYKSGKSAREAALEASNEISFVIVAMTITLVAVFLPIGFIEGFIGKLFIEFAWTLAFCVLFSGFVALTLTPMMASKMLHRNDSPPRFLIGVTNYLQFIQEKYNYYLSLTLDHSKKLIIATGLSIIILILSFMTVSKTFMPEEDNGFLRVIFTGPEGGSVEHTEKTVVESEKILEAYKEIAGFFVAIFNNSSAFAFVPLKDWSIRNKSQAELQQELNKKFDKIPEMSIFATGYGGLGSGDKSNSITFNIQTSSTYNHIDNISQKFVELMQKNPIFENVERDFKSSIPLLELVIDRDKTAAYQVSLDDIGTTIQYLIAGKQVGDFMMGSNVYNIVLQNNLERRNDVNDLREILIKTAKGDMIPLAAMAKIEEKITVKSYDHYNTAKSIDVSANLVGKTNLQEAMDVINSIADKMLDSSTSLEYLGSAKSTKESQSNSFTTFLFALLFIYLVLAAQFESFSDPLLILIAVPFSITGGVLTLLLAGNSLNMYSNIGLITLIGLITKNSIMIVEFANQLQEKDMSPKAAVLEAATLRLRPILMTSLATIFGAVPLVFADGAGAAARNSIGLVIVGGMVVGTIFTIFVIPVLYNMFKREKISAHGVNL